LASLICWTAALQICDIACNNWMVEWAGWLAVCVD